MATMVRKRDLEEEEGGESDTSPVDVMSTLEQIEAVRPLRYEPDNRNQGVRFVLSLSGYYLHRF